MKAVKTSLHANQLPDNLQGIRSAIETAVPHGRTDNGGKNDRGAWSDAPAHHLDVWAKMDSAYQAIIDKYPKLNHVQRINHLGTLGIGNHFIEVCLDENENGAGMRVQFPPCSCRLRNRETGAGSIRASP